jgi:hypothetical protein
MEKEEMMLHYVVHKQDAKDRHQKIEEIKMLREIKKNRPL